MLKPAAVPGVSEAAALRDALSAPVYMYVCVCLYICMCECVSVFLCIQFQRDAAETNWQHLLIYIIYISIIINR